MSVDPPVGSQGQKKQTEIEVNRVMHIYVTLGFNAMDITLLDNTFIYTHWNF